MAVNRVAPETFLVPPTAHSPNSTIPVIVYRNALIDKTLEGALAAIETSQWVKGGQWKISKETLAATPHYHSIAHEAYTVLHGSATYLLGKSPLDPETDGDGNPVGVEFVSRAGDVFIFPSDQNSVERPFDSELALDSPVETEKSVTNVSFYQYQSMILFTGRMGQCKNFGREIE
ncbi:hypothetical protein N7462_010501 [Penicillium macrosclerotiorum]|uniref:uncharacterized protein n=1 Tax=Penicillium macrosclerotiorum TaxID=303699 RepID=UPI0025469686|nr:uncharacterized protein N7462_010501 [Penicillium macrosclerotiorum]KAJ5669431.1 hypothetical protein N7462_010501 [Penicillium macrosclerotiorum]